MNKLIGICFIIICLAFIWAITQMPKEFRQGVQDRMNESHNSLQNQILDLKGRLKIVERRFGIIND